MGRKNRRRFLGPSSNQGQPQPSTVTVYEQQIQASAYSGPLPPPEAMAKYEAILPGFTDRVLTNFEKQSGHRMVLETGAIGHEQKMGRRGQICGLVVALFGLLIGGALIWTGHSVAGTVIATGDLVSLVGLFIYGKESSRRELAQKREQVVGPPQSLAHR